MEHNLRIRAMSSFIVPYGGVTRVLDLGAGDMALRTFLHGYTQYIPIDKTPMVIDGKSPTRIDLNKNPSDIITFGRVQYAVLSGVVEYLSDFEEILHILSIVADSIILSYNTATPPVIVEEVGRRRSKGWVNDFTLDNLISMMSREYYTIETIAYTIPEQPNEVIIFATHPGVWMKSMAPGCTIRSPLNEWRFQYDEKSWGKYQSGDPGYVDDGTDV